ncbi:MAG TPA: FUSC family protein [Thermodesulfobacteriota bacterium]|nr:FUSC family protein [Thermodesulfobacteriota bacterium]
MDISSSLRSVLIYAAIAVAGYFLGSSFTALFHDSSSAVGGFWSVISGVIVYDDIRTNVLRSAKLRSIGSLIGAAVSGAYLHFFAFSLPGFAACLGAGALICYLLRLPDHIKLTGVTISVVMMVSVTTGNQAPIENAALRFFESVIGAGVAVSAAYMAGVLSSKRADT